MRIGIYGGTFDPIHLGHMCAAQYAAELLHLDRLYLIPAGLPPHKHLADSTPAPEHRLHMTELAADALSRTECPADIIADILPGLEGTGTPYEVIEDRVEAIHWAMDHAQAGDVIVLCGKGHETYQEVGHEKRHMDEREIVAEYLK